jgi:hypothetical protein
MCQQCFHFAAQFGIVVASRSEEGFALAKRLLDGSVIEFFESLEVLLLHAALQVTRLQDGRAGDWSGSFHCHTFWVPSDGDCQPTSRSSVMAAKDAVRHQEKQMNKTQLFVRRGFSPLAKGSGLPSYASCRSANARCVCAVPENDMDDSVCNLVTRGEQE